MEKKLKDKGNQFHKVTEALEKEKQAHQKEIAALVEKTRKETAEIKAKAEEDRKHLSADRMRQMEA